MKRRKGGDSSIESKIKQKQNTNQPTNQQKIHEFCCSRGKEEILVEAEDRSEVNLGRMITCFYADGKIQQTKSF